MTEQRLMNKLSISNIAWGPDRDQEVYGLMRQYGFTGLEIAPTRILPETPYDRLEEAEVWSRQLWEEYGLCVPSMQSIWFGRTEKLFGTDHEREALLQYTKKAIDFAEAIGCGNLVFGCPRNRSLAGNITPAAAAKQAQTAVVFFKAIGEYAKECGTVIGMEANPPIYNTNYINDTPSALELIRQVDSKGFRLNLDVGTMIENGEVVSDLKGHVNLINHVHISEPGLKPIDAVRHEDLHRELAALLKEELYSGFVSIEMGRTEDLDVIEQTLEYTAGIFRES